MFRFVNRYSFISKKTLFLNIGVPILFVALYLFLKIPDFLTFAMISSFFSSEFLFEAIFEEKNSFFEKFILTTPISHKGLIREKYFHYLITALCSSIIFTFFFKLLSVLLFKTSFDILEITFSIFLSFSFTIIMGSLAFILAYGGYRYLLNAYICIIPTNIFNYFVFYNKVYGKINLNENIDTVTIFFFISIICYFLSYKYMIISYYPYE